MIVKCCVFAVLSCLYIIGISADYCSCSDYDDCDVCYLGYFGSSVGTTAEIEPDSTCYNPYITITMYYIESYYNNNEQWTLEFKFVDDDENSITKIYTKNNVLNDADSHGCYTNLDVLDDDALDYICFWGCESQENECQYTFNSVITRLSLVSQFNGDITQIDELLTIELYAASGFYDGGTLNSADGDFSSTIELFCSNSEPTISPTNVPTKSPSQLPSINPTNKPSYIPSISPTVRPTRAPLDPGTPTKTPSVSPTIMPTADTISPSINPSNNPSLNPTDMPISPSYFPSNMPSDIPTEPTLKPTRYPSPKPSKAPTFMFNNHTISSDDSEISQFNDNDNNSNNNNATFIEQAILYIILGAIGIFFLLSCIFIIKYRKNKEEKMIQKAMDIRFKQMLLIKEQTMKDRLAASVAANGNDDDNNNNNNNEIHHAATIPMIKAGAHHKKNKYKKGKGGGLSVAHLMARKDIADKTEAKIRLIDPAFNEFDKKINRSRISVNNRKDVNLVMGGEGMPAPFQFNFNNLLAMNNEGYDFEGYAQQTGAAGGQTGGGGNYKGANIDNNNNNNNVNRDENGAGEGGNDNVEQGGTNVGYGNDNGNGVSLEELENFEKEEAEKELEKRQKKELAFGQMLGDQEAVENAIFEDIVDDMTTPQGNNNNDNNNNNNNNNNNKKNALLDDEDNDNDRNNLLSNNNNNNNNSNNNGGALIAVDMENDDDDDEDDMDVLAGDHITADKKDEFKGALGDGAAVEDAIFDDIVEDMADNNSNQNNNNGNNKYAYANTPGS